MPSSPSSPCHLHFLDCCNLFSSFSRVIKPWTTLLQIPFRICRDFCRVISPVPFATRLHPIPSLPPSPTQHLPVHLLQLHLLLLRSHLYHLYLSSKHPPLPLLYLLVQRLVHFKKRNKAPSIQTLIRCLKMIYQVVERNVLALSNQVMMMQWEERRMLHTP